MSEYPTPYTLEFFTPGETVVDRFGNERPGKGQWVQVPVSSWWIAQTEEKAGESVLRTIDMLSVHVGETVKVGADSKIRLPDGSEWSVIGNPEDYRHGWHEWNPGLLVIQAKKVEG